MIENGRKRILRGYRKDRSETGRSCSSTIMRVICLGQTMKGISG